MSWWVLRPLVRSPRGAGGRTYVADYDDGRPVAFQLEGEPPTASPGSWYAPYGDTDAEA
jgi:hypothetical protein